ncbi:MAG: RNA polymerase sigma factor RpoD/SigA [Chitinophagales bacterium]|nr:RNA polymerase sigma factor RpoD/SigA [Chitinophagales bacterium]
MRQLKITQSITSRDSQSIEKYLHEIGKVDLISVEEEAQLARRIKKGDQQALQKLVTANLRFVVSVAKQYQNSYLSLNDLINEGNLGLIKAAQRFDETRGFKFISYGVWWIRQSIMQAISEQSRMVRLPLNQISTLNKLNKMFADLEQKYEREPTHDELSEGMNLNTDQIADTMKSAPKHLSMDAPFREGEDGSFGDVMADTISPQADNGVAYTDSLRIDTVRSLSRLTEAQRQVITLYFGLGKKEPMHLEGIGKELGLTRERIRQIKDRALMRLRSFTDSILLKDYLCK